MGRKLTDTDHPTAPSGQDSAMRTYATASGPDGVRAYVLLDGIGSTDEVRDWTRTAARDFVQSAIDHGSGHADNATAMVADLRP